ncbi:MAG TPA: UDP-N-acetylmuramoyl-L-alanine--D-glutamate ligase [Luteibaculaceae bacterium]|nr:UDP-N-acetylmuramoyl-L-alanine--D-glutamate ligase [Luteibaculaceae bacterium]
MAKAASHIGILGGGESGVGAACLAIKQGFEVFVSDFGTIKASYKTKLESIGVPFEENGHSIDRLLQCTEIIKSPGIPDKAPVVKAIREAGIPIIDELEFAFRFNTGKIVAITGSNGKTTTTLLTYHILTKAGLNVGLAGNVGESWAAQLAEGQKDYWVIEISSFQLDGTVQFRPDIAILTNITPDHLDRYENNMELYTASKFKITANQGPDQVFIYPFADPVIQGYLAKHPIQATPLPFGIDTPNDRGAVANQSEIIFLNHTNTFHMSIHELALQGKHNLYNSMASGIAARVLDIRKETIRESLSDFQGVEHRLEFVANVHGIEFVNDSKATNINSTWYALESAKKPVVWIVGGVDKGNDYTELMPLVKEKVKAIICLGLENEKIISVFSGVVPTIVEARSASAAVQLGYNLGQKGDVVLLSPACASFDLFENYEDRGRQFKTAVKAL